MVLRYDCLRFVQRSEPPLNLKIFISSDAFYDPTFLYEQLEFTGLIRSLRGRR